MVCQNARSAIPGLWFLYRIMDVKELQYDTRHGSAQIPIADLIFGSTTAKSALAGPLPSLRSNSLQWLIYAQETEPIGTYLSLVHLFQYKNETFTHKKMAPKSQS